MKDKIIDGLYKVKSYWKTPPTGYDVSYKEFANYTVGSSGTNLVAAMTSWVNIATTTPLLLTFFRASSGAIFIMTMFAALIGLLRAPLLSMLIDNHNSKNGKFKPFLLWSAIGALVCFTLIPFIPASWVGSELFHFKMPAIPIFGVAESSVVFSVGLVMFFVLMQIGLTFSQIMIQCTTGIENTISTVAQERSGIVAIKNLLSNLPNSLVNIVMPMVAAAFFIMKGDEKVSLGMGDRRVYMIFFPIIAIATIACVFAMVRGTKERIVVNKLHKNKVKFWAGAKQLSSNKYFWLIVIFTVFSTLRASANIYLWICNYAIGGRVGSMLLAVCNMILNNAFIPGLLLAPFMIKKFGKARVLTVANTGFAVMTALQLVLIFNPYATLGGIFFQNLFLSVSFISSLMTSDVLDYQQYKTNKRLEGFWQNYSQFIITISTIFTSILTPIFLSFGGISFGMEMKDALQDPIMRMDAFRNTTYLALIGGVLCIIPMLFYDLNENKHRNIIRALKVRKAVDNYKDNTLEDADIVGLNEVLDYIEKMEQIDVLTADKKMLCELKSMSYLHDEMKKYDLELLQSILQDIEVATARIEEKKVADKFDEFSRNAEFEERILELKRKATQKRIDTAKEKAGKLSERGKEIPQKLQDTMDIDINTWYNEQVQNTRFVKYRGTDEDGNYTYLEPVEEEAVEITITGDTEKNSNADIVDGSDIHDDENDSDEQ